MKSTLRDLFVPKLTFSACSRFYVIAHFDDTNCYARITALHLNIYYTKGPLSRSADNLLRLLAMTSILKHMSVLGGQDGGTRL